MLSLLPLPRVHALSADYDQTPMLICQLRGRKRVLLFPPAAYGTLLPYPSNHPLDRRATLDVGSCDVDDVMAR